LSGGSRSGRSSGSRSSTVASETTDETTRERGLVTADGLAALEDAATRRAVGVAGALASDELSTSFADVLRTSSGGVDSGASTRASRGSGSGRSSGSSSTVVSRGGGGSATSAARETANEAARESRLVAADGLTALENTAARGAVGVALALAGHELSTGFADVLGTSSGSVDGRACATSSGSGRSSRGSGCSRSSTTSLARETTNETTRERGLVTADGLAALEDAATRRAVGVALAFTSDELGTGFADVLRTGGSGVDGRASGAVSGGHKAEDGEDGDGFHD
jgi:hypothetical protein